MHFSGLGRKGKGVRPEKDKQQEFKGEEFGIPFKDISRIGIPQLL